jgi:GNAT superfamily N-acetyltransferase
VADAPLGDRPATVGRGSLPLDLETSGRPDVEAAALLSFEEDTTGVPFAITARREGPAVAAAWGWSARGALELADLVVAAEHRGQGIGRHVVAAVEALARRRECTVLGANAPTGGAAAALLTAAGFKVVPTASTESTPSRTSGGAGEPRRWEHHLAPLLGEGGG